METNSRSSLGPALPRSRRFVLARLLALPLLVACGGRQANTVDSRADGVVVAEPEPPPPEPLDFMPASSKMVFGIELSALGDAAVLARYRQMAVDAIPEAVKAGLAACGFDPFEDVDSVIIGIDHEQKGVAVITGNFTRETFEDCLSREAEKQGWALTLKEDGKVRIYEGVDEDETIYAYWPADNLVVFATNDMGGAETLERTLGGARLVDGELRSMVEATDRDSALWGAGIADSTVTGGRPPPSDVERFSLTINVTETVNLRLLLYFPNPDAATDGYTRTAAMLPVLKGMAPPDLIPLVDKIEIAVAGTALEVRVSLTGADIERLVDAVP